MAKVKQESEIELDLKSETQFKSDIEKDETKEVQSLESEIELEDNSVYLVEVIQDSKHLKIGETYKISGNVAKNLLSKNLIKLI
jgi:hypothetical protein